MATTKDEIAAMITWLRPLAMIGATEAADMLATLQTEVARLTERVDELTEERDRFADRIDELALFCSGGDLMEIDMSMEACMARYDAQRNRTIKLIQERAVSASMSGIEYLHYPAIELERDLVVLEMTLRHDGTKKIERPDWLAEFRAWKAELPADAAKE